MRYALGIGTMLAIACLIRLGLQVSSPTAEADETSQPQFMFSAEADQKVLTIQQWGGYSFEAHEYILWGDGRFERIVRKKREGDIRSQKEAQLEFIEMNDLVEVLVTGGLMEWDEDEISKRVFQAINGDPASEKSTPLFASSDSSWTEITINLDSYQSTSGERQSPASVKFSYKWNPHIFKRMFQPGFTVPEVDALISLHQQKRERLPRKDAP